MRSKILCVVVFFLAMYLQGKTQNKSKKKQPKNIILLIGDGMGVAQIYAGLTANKGSLNLIFVLGNLTSGISHAVFP